MKLLLTISVDDEGNVILASPSIEEITQILEAFGDKQVQFKLTEENRAGTALLITVGNAIARHMATRALADRLLNAISTLPLDEKETVN